MNYGLNKKTRIKYYEIMRILAIALVIFNHLPGYTLYMETTGPVQWFYMVISMITRVNVPIFFMISGALLLKKEEDYKLVLRNRILRIIILIVVFTTGFFLLCVLKSHVKNNTYNSSLSYLIHSLLKGDLEHAESYWFLYAYLGMLLMLPLLQRIAKGMKKIDFVVILVLHFLTSSLIPMINACILLADGNTISLSGNFAVPLGTGKAFFYPLIGYYLDQCIDIEKISTKTIGKLIIAALTGIMVSCGFTYIEGIRNGTFTQNYVQLFDYVSAIVVFIIVKKYMTAKEKAADPAEHKRFDISFIGTLTLGIYLLDPYLKEIIYNPYAKIAGNVLPELLTSLIWVGISMFIGGLATFVLKKIPVIGKVL